MNDSLRTCSGWKRGPRRLTTSTAGSTATSTLRQGETDADAATQKATMGVGLACTGSQLDGVSLSGDSEAWTSPVDRNGEARRHEQPASTMQGPGRDDSDLDWEGREKLKTECLGRVPGSQPEGGRCRTKWCAAFGVVALRVGGLRSRHRDDNMAPSGTCQRPIAFHGQSHPLARRRL